MRRRSTALSTGVRTYGKKAELFQKSWHELVRKPSYFEKAGTNWQGSWLISKKLARIGKEAELFRKSWHEMARKLAYFKKAGTKWQGSWLISKNLTRIGKEAAFFRKTRHEFARELAYLKKLARIRCAVLILGRLPFHVIDYQNRSGSGSCRPVACISAGQWIISIQPGARPTQGLHGPDVQTDFRRLGKTRGRRRRSRSTAVSRMSFRSAEEYLTRDN
jgi:hypothetical protein